MKKIIFVFLLSVLTFLVTCWSSCISVYSAAFAESLCYFVMTYIVLEKLKDSETSVLKILTAILLGRIILEIPVRVMDFKGSQVSFGITFAVILSILLAWLCQKEKSTATYVLTTIILVLVNSVGMHWWFLFINYPAQ